MKFDTYTVFVSKQGTGKSKFIYKIAHNPDWFSDSITTFDGKEFYEGILNSLSDVEFRNLTGRVGRLQYSLYGNVFLICIKDEEISPQSYVELLQSGIKKQTLSVSDLSDEAKQYIAESLTLVTTKLIPFTEQIENDFAFMRKTAGILL